MVYHQQKIYGSDVQYFAIYLAMGLITPTPWSWKFSTRGGAVGATPCGSNGNFSTAARRVAL